MEYKSNPEDRENKNEGKGEQNEPSLSPDDQNSIEHIKPIVSPIAAAFFGLIGGFFLYQVVGGVISFLIFGMDMKNAPVNEVRLITSGGQILFILLPALVFSKWIYSDVSTIIRFKLPQWREIGLFIIGIIILTPLLQNFLYIQNYLIGYLAKNSNFIRSLKSFFDSLNELIESAYGNLLAANNIFEGLFVIIVISMVPAVCEETMFRGFIQKSFEFKLKPFWAALITAIFFGLYHFNPYGLIPLIALGLYFGFAAYTTNSIFVPMILHFLNNFAAVILYFVFGNDELISTAVSSDVNIKSSIIAFIILAVLFSGTITFIRRYYYVSKNKSMIRNT